MEINNQCPYEQDHQWYHLAWAVTARMEEQVCEENVIQVAERSICEVRDKFKGWGGQQWMKVKEAAFYDLLALHMNRNSRLAFCRALDYVRKMEREMEK